MVHGGSGVCRARAFVTTAPVCVLTKTGGLEGALADIRTSNSELQTPPALWESRLIANSEAKAALAPDLSLRARARFRARLMHSLSTPGPTALHSLLS